MQLARKLTAGILIVLVLFFTGISILAIWDIIDYDMILSRSLKTLLVIFISSALVLFIFSMLYKPADETLETGNSNHPPR